MARFKHEGRSIHYLERGRGEPVVMLHGLGSSGGDWALQVAALESRYRLIIPDLPGCGHSAPARRCSIESFARDVWALLDRLSVPYANVVGFSLGGAVALEMALQRAGAVPRLALINSLACYRLDHWRKWLEAYLPQVLIRSLGMRWAARVGARRLFPLPWQGPLRERASHVVGVVPAADYLATGRTLIGWSALERLARLRSRVLMIAAEHDLTPLEEKRRHAAALGARLVIVRGSRHGTPFDAVEVTNASLLAWLADAPLPAQERWIRDRSVQPLTFQGSLADEHARAGRGSRGIDRLRPAY